MLGYDVEYNTLSGTPTYNALNPVARTPSSCNFPPCYPINLTPLAIIPSLSVFSPVSLMALGGILVPVIQPTRRQSLSYVYRESNEGELLTIDKSLQAGSLGCAPTPNQYLALAESSLISFHIRPSPSIGALGIGS